MVIVNHGKIIGYSVAIYDSGYDAMTSTGVISEFTGENLTIN